MFPGTRLDFGSSAEGHSAQQISKLIVKTYPVILAGTLACALLSGCASIMDGGPKTVTITSEPPGAKLTVADANGQTVSESTTPASISLKRSAGYFVPGQYKLTFEAPGYYPSEVRIKATLNGWYFGNIMFGGLIGLAGVDPATGAMWTFSPSEINRNLISSTISLSPQELRAAEAKANSPKAHEPARTAKK
jgi:hypothetical protein